MAESSSTRIQVLSTIYNNFLQCSICHGTFDDPRALPYCHAFCCECLENWSTACGGDNKAVSCPLCTKVYRIPEEEDIQGFPAQLLVAELQNTADKATQRKTTNDLCEHHGEKKIYFCENCVCTACSDCSILDPAHQGHTFIRLKQAALQQSKSLDNLTGRVKDVEQKYVTAVQRLQQSKQDVIQAADAKIKAIKEARNEHMQQMDNLVTLYKQDVYCKKEEKTQEVNQLIEKLNSDLDTITSSCKLAANVTQSGSDSDVISLYPSLSATLQQLVQSEPSPVDQTLGTIQLEPQSTPIYFPSLEQLLCDKLHITPHQPTHHTSNDTFHLSAGSTAALSTVTATAAVASSISSSAGAAKSILISAPSLDDKVGQDPSLRSADSEGLHAVSSGSRTAKSEPLSAKRQLADETRHDLLLNTSDSPHLSTSFQQAPNIQPTRGKRWKVWRSADSERPHSDKNVQQGPNTQPTSSRKRWKFWSAQPSSSNQLTSMKRWKIWRSVSADKTQQDPDTSFQQLARRKRLKMWRNSILKTNTGKLPTWYCYTP